MLKYATKPDYLLGEGVQEVPGLRGSGMRASTHREPTTAHEMFCHQRFGEISVSNQNMIAGVGV